MTMPDFPDPDFPYPHLDDPRVGVIAPGLDKLTREQVEKLQAEAYEKGMDIDYEAAKLVPRKYANMNHHQRAMLADMEDRHQRQRDIDKDNDPASPEQAWDERF